MLLQAAVEMQEPLRKRLHNFLSNPYLHHESRQEKLCTILHQIGVTEIPTLGNSPIKVDVSLCKRLIDGRNKAAHRGTHIDQELLYNALFPIAQAALTFLNENAG
jgi:hypothetical protein